MRGHRPEHKKDYKYTKKRKITHPTSPHKSIPLSVLSYIYAYFHKLSNHYKTRKAMIEIEGVDPMMIASNLKPKHISQKQQQGFLPTSS